MTENFIVDRLILNKTHAQKRSRRCTHAAGQRNNLIQKERRLAYISKIVAVSSSVGVQRERWQQENERETGRIKIVLLGEKERPRNQDKPVGETKAKARERSWRTMETGNSSRIEHEVSTCNDADGTF